MPNPITNRRRWTFLVLALLLVAAACGTSVEVQSGGEPSDESNATPSPVEAPTATPEPVATATPEPTATPTPLPGQLAVNDTDAVGTVGDELLSLAEAVQLANGSLAATDLSVAESELVGGEPGPNIADTITVVLPEETEILVPGGDTWIIELFRNDGDTVVGGDTVLTPATDELGVGHNVMLIGSAGLTVEGFTFDGVTQGIGIESAGRELDGITIRGNAFRDTLIHDITVQNSANEGGLSNLVIENNSFEAPEFRSDLHRFVIVQGGTGVEQQTIEGTFIRNLQISNNAMSAGPGAVSTCVSISGGFVDFAVTAEVKGASIEGVELTNNSLSGCDTGLLLAGGQVEHTNATVTENAITTVTLTNNTFTVGDVAVAVRGGYVEPAPESFQFTEPVDANLTANTVSDISIDNTVFSAYNVGASLVGGEFAVAGTGAAEGNGVSGLSIGAGVVVDQLGIPCVESPDEGALAAGNTLEASCAELGG